MWFGGGWMYGYFFTSSPGPCVFVCVYVCVCVYMFVCVHVRPRRGHYSVFVPARLHIGGQWDPDLSPWREATDGWIPTSLSRLVLFNVWVYETMGIFFMFSWEFINVLMFACVSIPLNVCSNVSVCSCMHIYVSVYSCSVLCVCVCVLDATLPRMVAVSSTYCWCII